MVSLSIFVYLQAQCTEVTVQAQGQKEVAETLNAQAECVVKFEYLKFYKAMGEADADTAEGRRYVDGIVPDGRLFQQTYSMYYDGCHPLYKESEKFSKTPFEQAVFTVKSCGTYCDTEGCSGDRTGVELDIFNQAGYDKARISSDRPCPPVGNLIAVMRVCPDKVTSLGAALGYAGFVELLVTILFVFVLERGGILKGGGKSYMSGWVKDLVLSDEVKNYIGSPAELAHQVKDHAGRHDEESTGD